MIDDKWFDRHHRRVTTTLIYMVWAVVFLFFLGMVTLFLVAAGAVIWKYLL